VGCASEAAASGRRRDQTWDSTAVAGRDAGAAQAPAQQLHPLTLKSRPDAVNSPTFVFPAANAGAAVVLGWGGVGEQHALRFQERMRHHTAMAALECITIRS